LISLSLLCKAYQQKVLLQKKNKTLPIDDWQGFILATEKIPTILARMKAT